MSYRELERIEDARRAAELKEAQLRANKAYNVGLWDAVKWNPFKWWGFLAYMRET